MQRRLKIVVFCLEGCLRSFSSDCLRPQRAPLIRRLGRPCLKHKTQGAKATTTLAAAYKSLIFLLYSNNWRQAFWVYCFYQLRHLDRQLVNKRTLWGEVVALNCCNYQTVKAEFCKVRVTSLSLVEISPWRHMIIHHPKLHTLTFCCATSWAHCTGCWL